MADFTLIGKNYQTPDLVAKVTGRAKYAEDFRAEGMVFARLLSSPMPHCRVRNIDASEALAMPGVVGILTADDVPEMEGNLVYPGRRPVVEAGLTNEPLYQGEPILLLAAVDETPPPTRSRRSGSSWSRCRSWSTRSTASRRVWISLGATRTG